MDDSSESKESYRKSSVLLNQERLLGLVPKGRRRIIFGPWTIVSTVFICTVIACIIASSFFISKHGHHSFILAPKSGLNFPTEYPKLDTDCSTQDCRDAWNSLTSIPCHEQVWSRIWDYGHYDSLDSDLNRLLPLICKEDCTDALIEAKSIISGSCGEYDHFQLHGYNGRFNTTLLEPNPVAVIELLVARQTHDCRTSPIGDDERGYCMTDLQERWDILDGLMVEPMHGVDKFLLKTNLYRIEPAVQMPGMTGGADWPTEHNYMREERRFGPGRGETTCSYCTLDWIGGKMKSWKPDLVYTEDGLPMGLPVYLQRMSKAGRRCAGENFTSLWVDVMDHYEERGLLDREGKWLRQPSGDKLYLFQHGPSAGDSPLPEIRDYLEEMADWHSSHPYLSEEGSEELEHVTSCLQGLHEDILSMTCYPFLLNDDLASNILDTPEHLHSSCSNHCQYSMQRLRLMTFKACPQLVSDQTPCRTSGSEVPFSLYEWREMIFSDSGSLATVDKAYGWETNNTSWMTQRRPNGQEYEHRMRQVLEDLRPKVPSNTSTDCPELDLQELTRDKEKGFTEWQDEFEDSVCSPCVWQRFADSDYYPKDSTSLKGKKEILHWTRTMRMLFFECGERSMGITKSALQKVDEAVQKVVMKQREQKKARAGFLARQELWMAEVLKAYNRHLETAVEEVRTMKRRAFECLSLQNSRTKSQ